MMSRQPSKHDIKAKKVTKKNTSAKKHPKYGTSKLEDFFAHEFLDKLGVRYLYQFEAKDIGRFFDFYLIDDNLIIEIDGDYWHGNPEKYAENELTRRQLKAQRIDEYKNKWALLHSIPILRIWESDIHNNPKKVMETLKNCIKNQQTKLKILENKHKRH